MRPGERLTDEELASAATEGSEAHFNLLVDRHAQLVYRLALGITGSTQDAEDVVQETFLRVLQNLDRFSPAKASFRTWLLTIARNQSINAYSSLKRRASRFFSRSRSEEQDHYADDNSSDPVQQDAETMLLQKQEYFLVEQALKDLPERQRTSLHLKAVENLRYAEIAQIMNTSESSVESLIFRARQTLLEKLRE
jgi:RNA polymerase sigma-70 factor (ECF subfamily)